MTNQMLSDRQWSLISPCVESTPNRGRPLTPDRPVFEGILHVMVNKMGWLGLPDDYPSFMTCYRRYNTWLKNGAWEAATTALFDDFTARTGVDLGRDWKKYLVYGENGLPSDYIIPEYLIVDPENNIVMLLFLHTLASAIRDESVHDFKSVAWQALGAADTRRRLGQSEVA